MTCVLTEFRPHHYSTIDSRLYVNSPWNLRQSLYINNVWFLWGLSTSIMSFSRLYLESCWYFASRWLRQNYITTTLQIGNVSNVVSHIRDISTMSFSEASKDRLVDIYSQLYRHRQHVTSSITEDLIGREISSNLFRVFHSTISSSFQALLDSWLISEDEVAWNKQIRD